MRLGEEAWRSMAPRGELRRMEADGGGWRRMEADGGGWRRMEADGGGDSPSRRGLAKRGATELWRGQVGRRRKKKRADEARGSRHAPRRRGAFDGVGSSRPGFDSGPASTPGRLRLRARLRLGCRAPSPMPTTGHAPRRRGACRPAGPWAPGGGRKSESESSCRTAWKQHRAASECVVDDLGERAKLDHVFVPLSPVSLAARLE
jgi:hypothetical protein